MNLNTDWGIHGIGFIFLGLSTINYIRSLLNRPIKEIPLVKSGQYYPYRRRRSLINLIFSLGNFFIVHFLFKMQTDNIQIIFEATIICIMIAAFINHGVYFFLRPYGSTQAAMIIGTIIGAFPIGIALKYGLLNEQYALNVKTFACVWCIISPLIIFLVLFPEGIKQRKRDY